MRRLSTQRGQDNEEIDLTPMLDVVFIMLIFFIVTATFVKEIGLDVNSPDKNQNIKDADKKSIVVRITNRDRIMIRGEILILEQYGRTSSDYMRKIRMRP